MNTGDYDISPDLDILQDAVITSMMLVAKARDHGTGRHVLRTQHYIRELALRLADHKPFGDVLNARDVSVICKAAVLHDVGKVGVPDRILLKPARLTPEEFAEMKRHTVIGRDTIVAVQQHMDPSGNFLRAAMDIAYCHHEKWDGTGYPQGLAGEAIPLSARLMAVADVYDALTSRRPYKEFVPHAEAMRILAASKGTHFDPEIMAALECIEEKFAAIALRFSDDEESIW